MVFDKIGYSHYLAQGYSVSFGSITAYKVSGYQLKELPEARFDAYLLSRPDQFFQDRLNKLVNNAYTSYMNKDKPAAAAKEKGAGAGAGADGENVSGGRKRRRQRQTTNQDVTENPNKPEEPAAPVDAI